MPSIPFRRAVLLILALALPGYACAQGIAPAVPSSDVVRTGATLAALALIPTIIVAMTSFTRIVIVLSMVRHAFGMPETPPNAVLVSLSLFLTMLSMGAVTDEVHEKAYSPYMAGTITLDQALDRGTAPLRRFMLKQTRDEDIAAVYRVAHEPLPRSADGVSTAKLVPAFMINELRVAFTIGFVILLPFLLIDIVVSAILLALGMMMVPPTTISLPIKLLMFVLVDGWALIVTGVVGSFG